MIHMQRQDASISVSSLVQLVALMIPPHRPWLQPSFFTQDLALTDTSMHATMCGHSLQSLSLIRQAILANNHVEAVRLNSCGNIIESDHAARPEKTRTQRS